MKWMKKFFIILCCLAVVGMAAVPLYAADTNGCDDDANDMISADFALCSIHAYNIGSTKNPEGSQKDLMREVIAMKTTLITQQMYRQYEQMDSLLRRFKTQLQKAVLTTNLKVAAGDASSTSSSSASSDSSFESSNRNIFIAGVRDCNKELELADVLACLNGNLTTIYNTSRNGENRTLELRKQLANDFKLMHNTVTDSNCKLVEAGGKVEVGYVSKSGTSGTVDCVNYKTMNTKDAFNACFDKMGSCLREKRHFLSTQSARDKK